MSRKLTDGQKLAAAKVLDTIYSIGVARGNSNELFAQEILMDLVARGIIDCFWAIPKNSDLDHRGIDLISKTSKGYYFLNGKSSWRGVEIFLERQTKLLSRGTNNILKIYPWLAVRCAGNSEAERSLFDILGDTPSCAVLPQEVAEHLARLIPNSVSASDARVVSTREERVRDEIVSNKRREPEEMLKQALDPRPIQCSIAPAPKKRESNRRKKPNFKETGAPLSTFLSRDNIPWRSRFEMLERCSVCVVRKWEFSRERGKRHWEWVVRIEIETDQGTRVVMEARDRKHKYEAEKKAAAMTADEIRRINRYKLVMIKL